VPNPLVAQGTLNKVRGSLVIPSFPALNITAPYLSKEGIRLSLQGESTLYLPTMTGAVTSQEPYMMAEVVVHMLKTQGLASQYKAQMESSALLGDISIRPDSTALGVYQIVNCAISGIQPLDFAGENAVFAVMIKGYYLCNATLFD
jgi:hypothetical protein